MLSTGYMKDMPMCLDKTSVNLVVITDRHDFFLKVADTMNVQCQTVYKQPIGSAYMMRSAMSCGQTNIIELSATNNAANEEELKIRLSGLMPFTSEVTLTSWYNWNFVSGIYQRTWNADPKAKPDFVIIDPDNRQNSWIIAKIQSTDGIKWNVMADAPTLINQMIWIEKQVENQLVLSVVETVKAKAYQKGYKAGYSAAVSQEALKKTIGQCIALGTHGFHEESKPDTNALNRAYESRQDTNALNRAYEQGLMQTSVRNITFNPDDIPGIICPITLDVMTDPMKAPSGHSFERAAIERHVDTYHTNPMTNLPMYRSDLIPDRNLKEVIDFLRQNGLI